MNKFANGSWIMCLRSNLNPNLFMLINNCMPRTGTRPHTWIVQGEIPHSQYLAFLQMRAQANYRGEQFLLTFEDFQTLWHGLWERKGRNKDGYCLVRINPSGNWVKDNVACLPRLEHLRRQKLYKQEKRNGKTHL
jgi:hypothetical protein